MGNLLWRIPLHDGNENLTPFFIRHYPWHTKVRHLIVSAELCRFLPALSAMAGPALRSTSQDRSLETANSSASDALQWLVRPKGAFVATGVMVSQGEGIGQFSVLQKAGLARRHASPADSQFADRLETAEPSHIRSAEIGRLLRQWPEMGFRWTKPGPLGRICLALLVTRQYLASTPRERRPLGGVARRCGCSAL